MKIRLLAVISLLLLSLGAAAQPSTFFGLKLGEKYTDAQVLKAMQANGFKGTKLTEEDPLLDVIRTNSFAGVEYDGVVAEMELIWGRGNSIIGVGINFTAGVSGTPEDLERRMKATISNYGLTYQENSGVNGFSAMGDSGIMVAVVPKLDGDILTSYSESYIMYQEMMSLSMAAVAGADIANPEVDMQDTFFGLKLGSKITKNGVIAAVGTKGKFAPGSSSETEYDFNDISFAGYKWDFGCFSFNEKSEFVNLDVYSSYDRYGVDAQRSAKELFEDIKFRLDRKYGEHKVTEEGDGKYVMYIGYNGIVACLRIFVSQAKSGLYRTYVQLSYVHALLAEQSSRAQDEEL